MSVNRVRKPRLVWLPVVPAEVPACSRLLLGLALHVETPDDLAEIAGSLGVSTRTAARHRDRLVRLGLLERVGGLLVPSRSRGVPGTSRDTAGHRPEPSAIPADLLADPAMTPARKVAAAELLSERTGFRRRRQWVRGAQERARRAAVSPATMRAAQRHLQDVGAVQVREVRRGRALLHEVRRTREKRGGRNDLQPPVSLPPANRQVDKSAPPHQGFPSVTLDSEQPRDRAAAVGDILRGLVGTSDHRGVSPIGWRPPSGPEASRVELRRALGDPGRIERLIAGPLSEPAKVAAVLEAAHVHDHAPRRRNAWADLVVRVGLRAVDVVTIAADVLRDDTVRNVGAVLAGRLRRITTGDLGRALSDDGPRNWRQALDVVRC